MGLVAQVFDEPSLTALRGDIAVAHCRYSTTGAPVWANAQPTFRSTPTISIALGHNGNLTNTRELAAMLPPESGFAGLQATSDTDVLTELLAGGAWAGGTGADGGVEEASARILPLVRGAYSLVYMDENTLYAARDPQGFRPLVIGKLSGGWVVASETAALDIVGATFVREVEPGELDLPGRAGRAVAAVRGGRAQGLPVRVRLPGPAGHDDRRPGAARDPRGDRAEAGGRVPGVSGPGHSRARVRDSRRDRLCRGQRHPLRPGPGEELLRRADLHPAEPDHQEAWHQAETQPAA